MRREDCRTGPTSLHYFPSRYRRVNPRGWTWSPRRRSNIYIVARHSLTCQLAVEGGPDPQTLRSDLLSTQPPGLPEIIHHGGERRSCPPHPCGCCMLSKHEPGLPGLHSPYRLARRRLRGSNSHALSGRHFSRMLPPPTVGWNLRRTYLFLASVELKKPLTCPVKGCPFARSADLLVLSSDSPRYR